MANILIAAGRAGSARMRKILASQHNLRFVTTIQEALDAARDCEVLLCGLEFDESRMFEFLQQVNDDPKLASKPRLCFRFIPTNTPESVIGGLEVAAKAVGAASLIDLPGLDEQYGAEGSDRKVREEIEALLNGARS